MPDGNALFPLLSWGLATRILFALWLIELFELISVNSWLKINKEEI